MINSFFQYIEWSLFHNPTQTIGVSIMVGAIFVTFIYLTFKLPEGVRK